jgi:hypothetical protein
MVRRGRPGQASDVAGDGGDTCAAAVDPPARESARALAEVVARAAGELAHAHVVTVVRSASEGRPAQVLLRWSPTGARGPRTDDALELAAGMVGHREPRRIVLRIRALDGQPSASGLVLPITVGEDLWGALVVTLQRAFPLRPSAERQLATLTELAALGLAGGKGRPGRRRADAADGDASLAHDVPQADGAGRAAEAISRSLGGTLVRMVALDRALPPEARVLAVAAGASAARPPVALDVALLSAIAVGERSLRVADVSRDPRFQRIAGSDHWQGAASVPVAVGHDVRGAITAYGDLRGVPTVSGTRFLLAAANVVAAALDCPRWGATVTGDRA